MKTYSKIFLPSLCIAYFISLSPVLAENQNIDKIEDLLKKEKFELKILKDKIKKQTQVLSKMGEKEFSSLKKQRLLDDQLKMRKRELKVYNWNLKINKKNIKNLMIDINDSKKQLYLQQITMARRLRYIYKEGSMFPVKILFSSDDFSDLLKRMKYMDSLAVHDSKLFSDYKSQVNVLSRKKVELLQNKDKLLGLKKSAAAKKKEINIDKLKKKRFLARLVKEKKFNERLKDELVQSSMKLNQLIARLEKKQIMGEGLAISDKKGHLQPPVKGQFLNKFGRKRDKQFDTYIVYNGINIRSAKGAPVRAVFEGKILYTGTLEGYGNIIILGHGNEYHSLYGHLDEIIAQVGKSVRSGQIIGRSGDTGSILGPSLYFEMRHMGSPIEPAAWLEQ